MRQFVLLSMLFLALWLTQLRFPPLSYPHVGLLLMVILAGLGAMLPYLVFKQLKQAGSGIIVSPAMVLGGAFLVWVLTRWMVEGMPEVGASIVGTWLWAGAYGVCGYSLAMWSRLQWPVHSGWRGAPVTAALLVAISVVGLLCGIHAVWQYHVAYEDSYRTLMAAIGNRAPDRTEMGLLHHLQLRRVASIWGDPNALATFSAMAIAASLELLLWTGARWRNGVKILGALSIVASLAAIYYSGSRAGVLDVLGVLVLFGGLWWLGRRKEKQCDSSLNRTGARLAVLGLIAAALSIAPQQGLGDVDAATTTESVSQVEALEASAAKQRGWIWRSDTIRERLYYWQTGMRMLDMAPVAGLGPGSVELYFGRLKPPEAREARHLHNWLVQTGAETGFVGVCLIIGFVGFVFYNAVRTGVYTQPLWRAFTVIYAVMVFDGLVTISWNQRELMCTFGLVCGLLVAKTAVPNVTAWRISTRGTAIWLGAAVVFTAVFLWLESTHLSARNLKQIAADAAYAGDAALAEEYWVKASRKAPRDPEPLVARAALEIERGRLSAARSLVEKALAAQPESAATHAFAAQVYAALRQPDKADTHLTEALRIYPSHPEYNYAYANFLTERGDVASALMYALEAHRNNYKTEDEQRYQELISRLNNQLEGQQP